MVKQSGYIFKQQILRLPDFSQPGQFKEESAARISESFSGACGAERLTRKASAKKLEFWHCFWVCFSCIFYEPLSLRVKQGVVTAVGVLVNLAVPYACKAPDTGQTFAEAADAGEHIDKSNHRFDKQNKGSPFRLPQTDKYVIFGITYLPPCIGSIPCPIISALEPPPKVNLKKKSLQSESHRPALGLQQRRLC